MSFAPTNPVHPKPGQLAAHPHLPGYRRSRRLADGFAAGEHARVCPAPAAVLAVSRHHAAGLCDADAGGQDLVYSPVWRMMPAQVVFPVDVPLRTDVCPPINIS